MLSKFEIRQKVLPRDMRIKMFYRVLAQFFPNLVVSVWVELTPVKIWGQTDIAEADT